MQDLNRFTSPRNLNLRIVYHFLESDFRILKDSERDGDTSESAGDAGQLFTSVKILIFIVQMLSFSIYTPPPMGLKKIKLVLHQILLSLEE